MIHPLKALETIAEALGPLVDQVVFVGGAAVPLLVSDPRTEEVRPTDDVDLIAEVPSRSAFTAFEEALRARGFAHDTSEGAPICRWRFGALIADVMPPIPEVLGFVNPWYPYTLETAVWRELPGGQRIRVASPVAFIATKIAAFQSPTRRYAGDVWASHDMEDILRVVEGRPEIDGEVAAARPDVRAYIVTAFASLLSGSDLSDAVEGHLPPGPVQTDRARALLSRLRGLAAG